MNLIETFQNLVDQLPEVLQPLIVALAGAIPFVEGEGAVTIGIIGGVNPVVSAIAAIVGNFACVAILVLLTSSARTAVVNRKRVHNLASVNGVDTGAEEMTDPAFEAENTRQGARHEKFQRALGRYGVPGVSLLGPLLLPTQFTATMLAAIGVSKVRVLIWQAVAIVGWTTVIAILMSGVVSAIA